SLNPLPLRVFLVLFFRRFTIWVPPVLGLIVPKPNCYWRPRWFFNFYLLCCAKLRKYIELKTIWRNLRLLNIIGVLLVGFIFWSSSFGAINGTPARELKRRGDTRAFVPWIFDKLGYDIFADFRETSVSSKPGDFWQISSESDRIRSIKGARLKRADLRYADMFRAFLVKANFRNSDLRRARMRETNLQNADIRGANLEYVDFRNANLRGTDFREANLAHVNFSGADFRNANLGLADL
ncbi:MAG: pentapeptide repeat-containing protein, partial [Deltaproteobacteria bacterium]|nr:pentapeptide repeat-containing protein [Deltaproteobacteria bacterium]